MQIGIIYLRYLLGMAYIFASIVKIKGERFTTESGASADIDKAWHMFETLYQSGLWWQAIGVAQFLSGTLLATQRFARLGVVIYLPIAFNIFLITISYQFRGTPVITSMMLLAGLGLLIWDQRLTGTLFAKTHSTPKYLNHPTSIEQEPVWTWTGIILVILTVIHRLFFFQIIWWPLITFLFGLAALIFYFLKRHWLLRVQSQ